MRKQKLILMVAPVANPLKSELFAFPPLGLLYVAALTPSSYEIILYDENVEPQPLNVNDFADQVDLVALTVMTSQAPRAYQLADEFRKRGIPVVMGGIHPTILPQEAKQHASAVIIGEAEGTWEKFLIDWESNSIQPFYRNERFPSLEGLPFPRRDLLSRESYIIPDTINVFRGCPHNCSFCSVTRFFGRTYRYRPLPEVIREIEKILVQSPVSPGRKFLGNLLWKRISHPIIGFMDDNIFGGEKTRDYTAKLLKALIPLKFYWGGQASVNIAKDEKLLELAAKSGCKVLFIGLESINPKSLKEARKRVNLLENYHKAVKTFHKHGIAVIGAFVFGFDSDDPHIFRETLEFSQAVKLDAMQVSILTPLPGTALWEKLEKENRIITKDWKMYDFTYAVYKPRNFTPEELKNAREQAHRRAYSLKSILKRFPWIDYRRWVVYSVLNYGYRKQIFKRI